MRSPGSFAFAIVLLATLGDSARSDPITINFDDRAGGTYPSDAYADSGVLIQRANIPDSVSIGSEITPTGIVNSFILSSSFPTATPSPPNFLFAINTLTDYLLTFTEPVTSASITTDTFAPDPEADILRLLALEPTGNPNEFRVIDLDQVAETSPGGVVLTVNPGVPFSFALIQITTEPEGFDNLTFTQAAAPAAVVPEPSSYVLWLSLFGLGIFLTHKMRRNIATRMLLGERQT